MRRNAFLIITLCVVAAVLLTLILGDERESGGDVTAVNVDVESGWVAVSNDAHTEEVERGGRAMIHPDGSVTKSSAKQNESVLNATANPAPSATAQPTPQSRPASLSLFVEDMQGQAVGHATAAIQQEGERRVMQLDETGLSGIALLSAGTAEITVSHPSLLVDCATVTTIGDGSNEVFLFAIRKGAYSALLKNENNEPVTAGAVTMTPNEDGLEYPQSDLADRAPSDEGFFTYDSVAAGAYLLSVTAPPCLPHQEIVTAVPDAAINTIVLSEKSHLSVTVRNEERQPIGGAQVTLQSVEVTGTTMLVNQTNDRTGIAVFDDIPPGVYRISAKHRWYQSSEKSEKEIEVTHDRHEATLILASRKYAISGTVYNSETKEPVGGAYVTASPDADGIKSKTNTTTGNDGRFRLEGLPGGVYLINAFHRDYIAIHVFAASTQGAPEPRSVTLGDALEVTGADIPLYPQWSVSGRVLLSDGSPLEGAEVLAAYQYVAETGGQTYSSTHDGKNAIKTGPDGTYKFTGESHVFNERCRVRMFAKHPVYQISKDVTVKPIPGKEIENVDLEYSEQVIVSGHVRDADGSPLADASIVFWNVESEGTKLPDKYANTQSDGSYQIVLERGAYRGRARCEGYRQQQIEEPLDLKDVQNADGVDFILDRGDDAFEGWVSEEDGTPIAGCDVHVLYVGHGFNNGVTNCKTDESGRFRLAAGNTSRIYHVEEFRIFTPTTEEYECATFKTTEWGAKDIHLTPKKRDQGYGNIGGVVQDQNGAPVTRYQLKLVPSHNDIPLLFHLYSWRAIESPEGAFHFENLVTSAAPYFLMARSEGSALAISEVIDLQKNEVREDIVIVMPRSFSIRGRVTDPEGRPLASAIIQFHRDFTGVELEHYSDALPQTASNPDGTFYLTGATTTGGRLHITQREEIVQDIPFNTNPDSMLSMDKQYGAILFEGEFPVAIGSPGEERDLGNLVINRAPASSQP